MLSNDADVFINSTLQPKVSVVWGASAPCLHPIDTSY